jgi:hypothetical protein
LDVRGEVMATHYWKDGQWRVMSHFEIEVTRMVEYKASVIVEAKDENDAYPEIEAMVGANTVPLEKISDHTEIGPIRKLD